MRKVGNILRKHRDTRDSHQSACQPDMHRGRHRPSCGSAEVPQGKQTISGSADSPHGVCHARPTAVAQTHHTARADRQGGLGLQEPYGHHTLAGEGLPEEYGATDIMPLSERGDRRKPRDCPHLHEQRQLQVSRRATAAAAAYLHTGVSAGKET